MKNILSLVLSAAVLLTVACKNDVDKAVVEQVQADVTVLDSTMSSMSKVKTEASAVASRLNMAPMSIKATEKFAALSERSGAINTKLTASMAQYNDSSDKLKSLSADYTAGKISKEDLQKEMQALAIDQKANEDLIARINTMTADMKTQYDDLLKGAGIDPAMVPSTPNGGALLQQKQ